MEGTCFEARCIPDSDRARACSVSLAEQFAALSLEPAGMTPSLCDTDECRARAGAKSKAVMKSLTLDFASCLGGEWGARGYPVDWDGRTPYVKPVVVEPEAGGRAPDPGIPSASQGK